mmetsp:Transcript_63285/g.159600  ORF Transcript_63285/g.159600 Transcript_63285/m.159600 type:complete len:201 (+) Transcript_63285:63-665(+)
MGADARYQACGVGGADAGSPTNDQHCGNEVAMIEPPFCGLPLHIRVAVAAIACITVLVTGVVLKGTTQMRVVSPPAIQLRTMTAARGEHDNSLMCSCPPAMAMWMCSPGEHDAIMNGTKCPYYGQVGEILDEDQVRVVRATAAYHQCVMNVRRHQVEGENIATSTCKPALREAHKNCLESVRRREGEGENVAVQICDIDG